MAKKVTAYEDIMGNLYRTQEEADQASFKQKQEPLENHLRYRLDDIIDQYNERHLGESRVGKKTVLWFLEYTRYDLWEMFEEERQGEFEVLRELGMDLSNSNYPEEINDE
jgi:hypothetical protein